MESNCVKNGTSAQCVHQPGVRPDVSADAGWIGPDDAGAGAVSLKLSSGGKSEASRRVAAQSLGRSAFCWGLGWSADGCWSGSLNRRRITPWSIAHRGEWRSSHPYAIGLCAIVRPIIVKSGKAVDPMRLQGNRVPPANDHHDVRNLTLVVAEHDNIRDAHFLGIEDDHSIVAGRSIDHAWIANNQ